MLICLIEVLLYIQSVRYDNHLPHGLVVRISGFHPGGPGSIPGAGKHLFPYVSLITTLLIGQMFYPFLIILIYKRFSIYTA